MIYVHCYNHRLNLVLVDVCKNLTFDKEFFNMLETLYVFLTGSAIHSLFLEIQEKMYPTMKHRMTDLKKISYTRWSAQVNACLSLKKLFSAVLVLLHKMINERHDRCSEAKGLLLSIDFNFVFCLCLYYDILSKFKKVSDNLQDSKAELGHGIILVKSLQNGIQEARKGSQKKTFQ